MSLESATFLDGLVATNPVAGDNVSQGDDHIRMLKAVLKGSFPNVDRAMYLERPMSDLASSTTPDLSTVSSNYINITGTTQIDGFASEPAGFLRILRFNAALTLNYNGTSFQLPGGDDILTAAGDHCIAISLGSGNWQIRFYYRVSGRALVEAPVQDIEDLQGVGWGRHTIWLPGDAFRAQQSTGWEPQQKEFGSSLTSIGVFQFPATGALFADAQFALPKSWNTGVLKAQIEWLTDATDTDGVVWQIQLGMLGDGDALSSMWGSIVKVTDNGQSSSGKMYITAETGDITAGNSGNGKKAFCRIFRDPAEASDTIGESCYLAGVRLFYSVDKVNDA